MLTIQTLAQRATQLMDEHLVLCPHTPYYDGIHEYYHFSNPPLALSYIDAASIVTRDLAPAELTEVLADLVNNPFPSSAEPVLTGDDTAGLLRDLVAELLKEKLEDTSDAHRQRFAEAIGVEDWRTYESVVETILYELESVDQIDQRIEDLRGTSHYVDRPTVNRILAYCQIQGHPQLVTAR